MEREERENTPNVSVSPTRVRIHRVRAMRYKSQKNVGIEKKRKKKKNENENKNVREIQILRTEHFILSIIPMSILLVVYVSNKRFSFKLFRPTFVALRHPPLGFLELHTRIHHHLPTNHVPFVNFITFPSVIRDRAISRWMKLNRVNASPVGDMPARHTTRSP